MLISLKLIKLSKIPVTSTVDIFAIYDIFSRMKSIVIKITVTVGRNIRKYREMQGFSQEAFADFIDLDRSNYGAIERGERNISITTLSRIAVGLQVEVGNLFPSIKEVSYLLKQP